jgi:hypothetical protein
VATQPRVIGAPGRHGPVLDRDLHLLQNARKRSRLIESRKSGKAAGAMTGNAATCENRRYVSVVAGHPLTASQDDRREHDLEATLPSAGTRARGNVSRHLGLTASQTKSYAFKPWVNAFAS